MDNKVLNNTNTLSSDGIDVNSFPTYERVIWENGAGPAINADNLNRIEVALESLLGNGVDVGALQDVITSVKEVIDLEISTRKTDIDSLNTDIDSLNTDITTLTQTLSNTEAVLTEATENLSNKDAELQEAIATERRISEEADEEIKEQIRMAIQLLENSVLQLLRTEANERSNADIRIESKIPTKVSQLSNDKNYLTEHQSLEGKADKIHAHKLADITDYTPPTPPDLSKYVTEEQLNNYYTKTQTDTAIQDAIKDIVAPDVNLSEYAKKSELPTKVSQLENDKGYLTSHQSLSNYYTKSETNTQIQTAIAGIDFPKTDLSQYYTKSEIAVNTIMDNDEVILYCGDSTNL